MQAEFFDIYFYINTYKPGVLFLDIGKQCKPRLYVADKNEKKKKKKKTTPDTH